MIAETLNFMVSVDLSAINFSWKCPNCSVEVSHRPPEPTPLEKAIAKAGGRRQLAELLGAKRQSVEYWLKHKVPWRHALAIEKATGVSRKELLPELFE